MWYLHLLALGSTQLRIGPTKKHVDDLGLDAGTGSPYLKTILNYTYVSNTSDVMVVGSERIPLRSNIIIEIPYKVAHHVEASKNSRREFIMSKRLDEAATKDPIALIGTCGSGYGVDGTPLSYDECRIAIAHLKTGKTTSSLTGDGCFVTVDKYATRLHFTSTQTGNAIPVTKCWQGERRKRSKRSKRSFNATEEKCRQKREEELPESMTYMQPIDEIEPISKDCNTHADCQDGNQCATTVRKPLMSDGMIDTNLIPTSRVCIAKTDCSNAEQINGVSQGDSGTGYVCGDFRCVDNFNSNAADHWVEGTWVKADKSDDATLDSEATDGSVIIFDQIEATSTCNGRALNEKQCREHAQAQGGHFEEENNIFINVNSASAGCYSYGTKLDADKCDVTDGSCPLMFFYTDGCHALPSGQPTSDTSTLPAEEICEEDDGWSRGLIVGVALGIFFSLLLIILLIQYWKAIKSFFGFGINGSLSTSFL